MAVAAANCINIPVMRQRELIDGIMVTDKEGNNLGIKSKVRSISSPLSKIVMNDNGAQVAARKGISLVVLSRILLVSPSMSKQQHSLTHLLMLQCTILSSIHSSFDSSHNAAT